MRRAMIFVLAGVLTLGLAAGAMAWGGYGIMGGGYGGHMMQPGYHMGYGPNAAYGPNGGTPGYGPANCPGWQAYQNGQQPAYGPGYGPGPNQQRGPAGPNTPADNLER